MTATLLLRIVSSCIIMGSEPDLTSPEWQQLPLESRWDVLWRMRSSTQALTAAAPFLEEYRASRHDDARSLARSAAWWWWQAEGTAVATRREELVARARHFGERAVAADPNDAEANGFSAVALQLENDLAGWSKERAALVERRLKYAIAKDTGAVRAIAMAALLDLWRTLGPVDALAMEADQLLRSSATKGSSPRLLYACLRVFLAAGVERTERALGYADLLDHQSPCASDPDDARARQWMERDDIRAQLEARSREFVAWRRDGGR